MKRYFAAILLLIGLIGQPAMAKSFDVDGIVYKDLSGTDNVEISKCKKSGSIVIPGQITVKNRVYHVTAVGKKAFSGVKDQFSVALPVDVKTIGQEAFSNSGLNDISMPGVEKIGERAFSNCASLKTLTIPATVTVIDNGAFASTPLARLAFSDTDTPLTLNNYGTPMFDAGAGHLYIGRPLKFTVFPFGGGCVASIKKFLCRKGIGIKWEGDMPQIIPGTSAEGCVDKAYLSNADWNVLEDRMDYESNKALEAYKKQKEEEERQAAIRKAEEREEYLSDVIKTVESNQRFNYGSILDPETYRPSDFYKRTNGGYVITYKPMPVMAQYPGDYSVPTAGQLHGPRRTVTITVTPNTITVNDVEEIQAPSDFDSRTGNPKRPEDPFRSYLDCPKGVVKCEIPSFQGVKIPFTYSCSHSMYKTPAGPYAPWRVKHTTVTTYNINNIATLNKISARKVWDTLIDFALKYDYVIQKIDTKPNGDFEDLWAAQFRCKDLDVPADRVAWIYALVKMRNRLKK